MASRREGSHHQTSVQDAEAWTTVDGRTVEVRRYINKNGDERYTLHVNGHALQQFFTSAQDAQDWFQQRLDDPIQPDRTQLDERCAFLWIGPEGAYPPPAPEAIVALVRRGLVWQETPEGGLKTEFDCLGIRLRIRPDKSSATSPGWYVLINVAGHRARIGATWMPDPGRIFDSCEEARSFIEATLSDEQLVTKVFATSNTNGRPV
jgi:hypothetical protein